MSVDVNSGIFSKINGEWQSVTAVFIKINGEWVNATKTLVKVDDAWETVQVAVKDVVYE